MPDIRVFLSCVSAEFSIYRDLMRRNLTRPNVTVHIQEDFISTGTETLDKLDLYISGCDAVIHFVGDMTGAMAQANSVTVIRHRYPNLPKQFPDLKPFLEENGRLMSYTQWEAWLALYHRKPLFIAKPTEVAPRNTTYCLDEMQRTAQQEHLNRLKSVERYPEIHFDNPDALAVELLRSGLQDILAKKDEGQSPRSILLRRIKKEVRLAISDRLPNRFATLGNEFELYAFPRPHLRLEHPERLPDFKRIDPVNLVDSEGGLLILGALGAGKTTELWQLAEQLCVRAEMNPGEKVPLFLDLNSWGGWRGSFFDWTVEQLGIRYGIGCDLARQLLNSATVTLLFDGLDEIEIGRRRICVEEINCFIKGGTQTVAVCCRFEEYIAIESSISLPAIVINPLTFQQVNDYVKVGGRTFEGLAKALEQTPGLRELLQTPLWLNICTEVYSNWQPKISTDANSDELKPELWNSYIHRMVSRSASFCLYEESSIRHYLSWLAITLRNEVLSELFLEHMQPSWLDTSWRNHFRRLSSSIVGLASGLAFGLAFGFVADFALGISLALAGTVSFGVIEHTQLSPTPNRPFWRLFTFTLLTFFFTVGLIVNWKTGLVTGVLCAIASGGMGQKSDLELIQPTEISFWNWDNAFTRLRESIGVGIGVVAITALVTGLADGQEFGLWFGLTSGLLAGFGNWLNSGWTRNALDAIDIRQPNEGIRRSVRNALRAAIPFLGLACMFVIALWLTDNSLYFLGAGFSLFGAFTSAMENGLRAAFRHLALRLTIRHANYAPYNYTAFLSAMSEIHLLRKHGGGFSFYHVDLRDYLATQWHFLDVANPKS